MLFFEEALTIFVRLVFFIFQVVLCSIDIIWNFIYLISSLVGSVFFTILTNGCVIFLDFVFLPIMFLPLLNLLLWDIVSLTRSWSWSSRVSALRPGWWTTREYLAPVNIIWWESPWRSEPESKTQFFRIACTTQSGCLTPHNKQDRNTNSIISRRAALSQTKLVHTCKRNQLIWFCHYREKPQLWPQ